MLDLLPPWAIKAAIVISALALVDVLLYMACVRVERRKRVDLHANKSNA